jgi:membrane protease YdiL (CAAX protease family)
MLVSLVAVIVGLPLIYILSRALKLRPKPITIARPKKEAALASIVTVALFIVVFGWRTLTHAFQLFDERSPFLIGPSDILWRAFLDCMCFVVILIAMKSTGQRLGSIGISRNNIGRMLTLGLVSSAIYLALTGLLAPSLGGKFAGLSPELVYGFVLFALVGFSEEILWRGYIQTRLAAHIGNLKGFVITSLLFTVLWHFPGQFFLQSGAVLDAFANTFTVLAPSLLFGYLMLKSQNVLPSSIFHLFWDWNSASLWQIPV